MLVIRRFANASRLILTVASIGLAQLLGGLEFLAAKAARLPLADRRLHVSRSTSRSAIGAKTLAGDEILIMMVVPFVILGLAYFLLRTDAGVAVRAAAENADRALLLGIPVRRLATIVWALAGGLSALTFILKAPFSGVVPGVANGPTVLLPGLAAAVVARMESLPVAFAAGLGLGIVEQTVRWNASGSPSFVNVAYLVVILGALLLQKGRLSRAVDNVTSSWSATGIVKPIPVELRHLPEVRWRQDRADRRRRGRCSSPSPAGGPSSQQLLAAFAMVWAMVAVSLVVLTGWGGHISLGQFGLVGVGGDRRRQRHLEDERRLLPRAVPRRPGRCGRRAAGRPAGAAHQGPVPRRHHAGVRHRARRVLLQHRPVPLRFCRPTSSGRCLWQRFDLEHNYDMYLVCLAFLGLSILAAIGVRKARSGRVVIATRDNQRAADAAAVNTTAVKLSAFLLAGLHRRRRRWSPRTDPARPRAAHLQPGRLHHGVFHGGHRWPRFDQRRASPACCCSAGSRPSPPWATCACLLTGTGLLVVLYALPGGFGQLFISVPRPVPALGRQPARHPRAEPRGRQARRREQRRTCLQGADRRRTE